MKIDYSKIKMLSTIGSRASVGLHLLDIAKFNKNLIVLTSDVSTSAGLDRYRKKFSDQYLDVGIAEQNLIGVAAGLASEGHDVITTTFAPFQTMRCCEQIKVNLGYMKHKVTMIGLASGLVLGNLGYTHCCIEDISVLRGIPNISIISPCDSFETIKAIDASIKNKQSTYIRITGSTNNPIIFKKDYNFKIGKTITLEDGKDICIFATGPIIKEALIAREILKKKNIKTKVVNVHTLKPIDHKEILSHSKSKKLLVTIEEHNIIGGLASVISEVLSSEKKTPPLVKIGIQDQYDKGGNYEFLKRKHNLEGEKIVKKILKKLSS